MPEQQTYEHAIDELSSLCRDELAAAERYRVARHGAAVGQFRTELSKCETAHEERASLLKARIAFLGGHPPTTEGFMRKIATAAQEAVAALNEHATLSLLEATEKRALETYRTTAQALDADNRRFLDELLPKQQQTLRIVDSLKHAVS